MDKVGRNKTFYLYFHIPFDIGFKIGGITKGTLEIIRKCLEKESEKITILSQTEIVKPKPLQEIFKGESNVSLSVIHLDLNDLIVNKAFEINKCKIFTKECYITVYDTGIGIGHLKYEIVLNTEISPNKIYETFIDIYKQLETLERDLKPEEIESDSASVVRNMINKLRNIRDCIVSNNDTPKDNTKDKIFDRQTDGLVLYIYPLFYLPSVNNIQVAYEYVCLSFLRPKNEEVIRQELESAISFNTQSFTSEFLLVKWDAAITGGSSVDERTCESFENILEICSYIWNSMYIFEGYIGNELRNLTTKQFKLDAREARKKLDQIQILRVEAARIQGIYGDIIVSLWASATQVFEKILTNSWNINKLQKSLQEKIDLLTFIYDFTVDESERTITDQMNTTAYIFQRIAIPIAAVIAILPFLTEPIISNRLLGSFLDVKWLLLLDALILTILSVIISYIIDKRRVELFQEKMRVISNLPKKHVDVSRDE